MGYRLFRPGDLAIFDGGAAGFQKVTAIIKMSPFGGKHLTSLPLLSATSER